MGAAGNALTAAGNAQSSANEALQGVNSNAGDITNLTSRIQTAEQKITADTIVSTVINSQQYKTDQENVYQMIDDSAVWVKSISPESPELNMLWLDISMSPSV